ncbi:MAG TPA: helix-turn-helix domain-containing protein [Thermoleophilaceae bacterium]|nr:helix-turn-helix domain-containing protein [Thermoleophilaceae bacterium]
MSLDAIADPVRLSIVRHLADHPGASLPELAGAAGVHLNTARPHATALEDAAVIEREPAAPSGRGRPRLGYRLAAGWSPPTADFRGLAELMSAAVLRAGPDAGELRRVGEEWGRYLQGRPGAHDVQTDVPLALSRLGFDARVEDGRVELRSCPCSLVVPDRPELVCGLAAAVVEGVLEGSGSGLTVAGGDHDPDRRRCSLELTRTRRAGPRRTRRRATRDA